MKHSLGCCLRFYSYLPTSSNRTPKLVTIDSIPVSDNWASFELEASEGLMYAEGLDGRSNAENGLRGEDSLMKLGEGEEPRGKVRGEEGLIVDSISPSPSDDSISPYLLFVGVFASHPSSANLVTVL